MSSSSYRERRQYEVFLSFRGEDTRDNFTSHLHEALVARKINTFIDNKLEKGTEVSRSLLRAIEGSLSSIVVFSENYARSRWCLDELVKMMECHRSFGQMVFPVFYKVDPSHVRHQKGAFGDSYRRLLDRSSALSYAHVFGWTKALTDAANLAGWHSAANRTDAELISKIVQHVLGKVDSKSLPITDFPVGLQSRAQDVIPFLKPSTVCTVLGIWGMGGSGKSSLAKVMYNQIHRDFVDTSFLANIREAWSTTRGQIDLQEQLLCDILHQKKVKVNNIELGKAMIKKTLCRASALVVLDDVSTGEQLQVLCGNRTWISPGSVVIITTRDVHVLNVLKPDHVIRTKEMNETESLELFSWHAFKEEEPREDFIQLSRSVVSYCGGLPLALEVLGSFLFDRPTQAWRSVLAKLKIIPN